MPETPPPGCELCDVTWQRRATVFDQLGFSPSTKLWYHRCVGCDTRWRAGLDSIYPMDPAEDLPADRKRPDQAELGPAVLHDDLWTGDEAPPWQLPDTLVVGPVIDRRWRDGRLVIPFAENLRGTWIGTPLQSRVAQLASFCLILDVLRPDVDPEMGAAYEFRLTQYVDELGHLHSGYGRREDKDLDVTTLDLVAHVSRRERSAEPPAPAEALVTEGRARAFGPGVHAPVETPFNRVVLDSDGPTERVSSTRSPSPAISFS